MIEKHAAPQTSRTKAFKKIAITISILLLIVGVGVLIAFIVDMQKELQRTNFGYFEINLSNSGVTISRDVREVQIDEIKVGQINKLKFSLGVTSSRATEFEDAEKTKPIQNGVYVRIKISGHLYNVDSSGNIGDIAADYDSKMQRLLNQFIYSSTNNWHRSGSYLYYIGGEENDVMLFNADKTLECLWDLQVHFNNAIVDTSWCDYKAKITFEMQAIDYLSEQAASWRAFPTE